MVLSNLFRWSNLRAFFVGSLATEECRETIRLYNRVSRAYRRSGCRDLMASAALVDGVVNEAFRRAQCAASPWLKDIMRTFARQLFEQEAPFFAKPEPPSFEHSSSVALQGLRQTFAKKERMLSDPAHYVGLWRETVIRVIELLVRHFPASTSSQSNSIQFSVPMIDICKDFAKAIESIAAQFYGDEVVHVGLFEIIRERLDANLCRASGMTIHEAIQSSRKPVFPVEARTKDRHELLKTYASGTPLEFLFSTTVQYDIPPERFFEGCWIVAPQGTGKSNLLRHLILHRLKEDATIIIIDPKGDLFSTFSRLASINDRLVILDPREPLAINVFDRNNSLEFLQYLFGVFQTEMTSYQSTLFTLILTLIEKLPTPNIEDFWTILKGGWKQYDRYIEMLSQRDQQFFYEEWSNRVYAERRPEIQARLRFILNHKYLGPIFASQQTKLDMANLLESGRVICINTDYETFGDFGAEVLGRLFLAMIRYAGKARTGMKPVYIFCDEADLVIKNDEQINDIVTKLRSKQIAATFAHQEIRQINNEKVRAALGDCAVKFANPTGEAAALVHFFPNTSADFLKELDLGEFACFVNFKTKAATKVRVPYYPVYKAKENVPRAMVETLKESPFISDREYQELLERMKQEYCLPPAPQSPASPAVAPSPAMPSPTGPAPKTSGPKAAQKKKKRW